MVTLEQALIENSISKLMLVPKSDIHTHGGKGGRIKYFAEWANAFIKPSEQPFNDLNDMQSWFNSNIKIHDNGIEGYLKRVEAAFVQAREDNIVILSLSFSIEVIDSLGGIDSFINTLNLFNELYAPETQYFPELSLGRDCNVNKTYDRVEEILSKNRFKSIDICGDEFAQPIKNFQKIFRMAQRYGVKLKAHVGEFGTADDVMEAVETLELSEVHHGIAAVKSQEIMKWLNKHKIQLNVCPTSNIMLKRSQTYANHPIKELFENGIPVTINTDDLLIFDSSVSDEYLKLYTNKVFSADDLEIIRETGLKSYK
jgi:adenosine deaminase